MQTININTPKPTPISRSATQKTGDKRKRLLDIIVTGLGLITLMPLFTCIALAIKLTSPGPVLFKQTRIGKDGVPFAILKFRTMHQNAERRREELLVTSDRRGVCFKSRNDPRVTSIGHFLRRFSIDELPQLLNVLKGDMSLVGPRPALASEVEAYPVYAHGRLACKPGITGIWQVSGRADISFETMVSMDIAYARSNSLALDMMILALTGRAILVGKGAY